MNNRIATLSISSPLSGRLMFALTATLLNVIPSPVDVMAGVLTGSGDVLPLARIRSEALLTAAMIRPGNPGPAWDQSIHPQFVEWE
jgi:hypothetical protein